MVSPKPSALATRRPDQPAVLSARTRAAMPGGITRRSLRRTTSTSTGSWCRGRTQRDQLPIESSRHARDARRNVGGLVASFELVEKARSITFLGITLSDDVSCRVALYAW